MVLNLPHLRVLKAKRGAVDEENYGLDPQDLQKAMQKDLENGLIPFFVVPTVGTTSTTAIDPVAEIVHVARSLSKEHYVWVHLDAAYAGAAAMCPELRHWFKSVEDCDSLAINAHKWLLVSFDCSLMWVKSQQKIIQALTMTPEYLKNAHLDQVNYKDWQVPLGRRFRALKLWFTLRRFGAQGLRAHIQLSLRLAQKATRLLEEDGRFDIVVPTRTSLVCFKAKDGRLVNEKLLKKVNESGKLFLIHTKVDAFSFLENEENEEKDDKVFVLRLAIGGFGVDEQNVQQAIQTLRTALDAILKEEKQKKTPKIPKTQAAQAAMAG